MRSALPLLVGLTLWSIDTAAHACSGCFSPSLRSPAENTEVPANALGLFWATYGMYSADTATLTDLDTGMEIPLNSDETGTTHLYPAQPAEAGHQYRFTVPQDCRGGGATDNTVERTLIATAPVTLPATGLGTLVASEPSLRTVPIPADVSCSESTDAVAVDVTLELSPELLPFADVLMFYTYVDGERWGHLPGYFADSPPGESWQGRGEDRLFELCNEEGEGGSPALRTVQFEALVPGNPGVSFLSTEVDIVLDCQMAAVGDGSGTEGEATGGGTGGSGSDGGGDAGQGPGEGGCSCRSAAGSKGSPDWLMLLGIVAIARRRTR